MKLIIAGNRHYNARLARVLVKRAITASGWLDAITEIVHGACNVGPKFLPDAPGIDAAAEYMCSNRWPIKRFPANWKPGGPMSPTDHSAGPRRNAEMAAYADALIVIWPGDVKKSPGSFNMKMNAEKRGLPVFEVIHVGQGMPL